MYKNEIHLGMDNLIVEVDRYTSNYKTESDRNFKKGKIRLVIEVQRWERLILAIGIKEDFKKEKAFKLNFEQ